MKLVCSTTLLAMSLLVGVPVVVHAEAPSAVASRPIEAIVVDADAVDAELRLELALRANGRELQPSDAITELPHVRFVWLSVRWQGDARAQLELIGADGFAYARDVTAPREQLRRVVASTAANMIAAIERGEIVADRSGVAVPRPEAAAAPTKPAAPVVVAPASAPVLAPRHAPPSPPRWELGPHVDGGVVIGLGPPLDLDGLAAAGGGIGLDARHRSGALLGLSTRASTLARGGLRIVRVRVAVSAGHALRRGRFELLSRLGIAVEPIVLRDHGARGQPRRPDGTRTHTAPLVGVLAGVSPGVLLRANQRAHVRLSLDLELGAAMEARAKPGAVRYLDERGDTPVARLRAGGVELGIGLGVGGWFALR